MTRERLLEAAVAVFQEVGYRAATVDAITARAGANRATFYLHFKDKIDVAATLGRRAAREVVKAFLKVDSPTDLSLQEVRAWLVEYVALRSSFPLLERLLLEAVATDTDVAREELQQSRYVADRMTQYLSCLSGKRREVARSKIILLDMLLGQYFCSVSAHGLPFPGEHELDALSELVWQVLYGGQTVAQKTPS
ncbi:MAG TPA: TetR/AcrR family transcriptional regulator [Ramlibacter sp.]|nr:TetR/AcrR family transcriptional regulator [Ramlibacter sp.]